MSPRSAWVSSQRLTSDSTNTSVNGWVVESSSVIATRGPVAPSSTTAPMADPPPMPSDILARSSIWRPSGEPPRPRVIMGWSNSSSTTPPPVACAPPKDGIAMAP